MAPPPPPPPSSRAFLAYGKLRIVYDLVPVGIILADEEGRVQHANTAAQELFGMSQSEMRKTNLAALADAGHEGSVHAALADLHKGLNRASILSMRCPPVNNQPLYCHVIFSALRGDTPQEPFFIVVTLQDVTTDTLRQLRVGSALSNEQEGRRYLVNLLDTMGDAACFFTRNQDILPLNEQGRKLTRLRPHEDETLPNWNRNNPSFNEEGEPFALSALPITRALRGEHVRNVIVRYQDNPNWMLVSADPFYEGSEILGAVGIFRDVTDLIEHKMALEKSNADLERFAAVASHDLQEPPRQIAAFAERILDKHSDELPGRSLDYLNIIQRSASRMQVLVSDLLTYSRVGHTQGPFTPCNLEDSWHEEVASMARAIESKSAIVKVISKGDCVIIGDRTQIEMIFHNLLSNALKFSKEGSVPEVVIVITGRKDSVEVEVIDNGIGFDTAYSEIIFEVFRRLVGRAEYPGTGIGLALCRRIVEHHKGTISAHSTPGVGSRFFVSLPRTQEAG